MLSFLTDDTYAFEFREHTGEEIEEFLKFEKFDPFPGADTVCLFSGGADSLAGAVQLVREGSRPLLISHRSAPVLDARQKNLRGELERAFPAWPFPHISVWVNRSQDRPVEHTQRSRSFLFLSLAAAAAVELNIARIVVPENGIVTFNLPKLEQAIGARSSRSTRPRFLADFRELLRLLTGMTVEFENPFAFSTKAEVLRTVADAGVPELIQESVSCAHTMARPLATPHCGVCSQCVDRRFASLAANLSDYDLVERYEVDILTDALQGEARQQAESHVRAAQRFEKQTVEEFLLSHRQVVEALDYLRGSTDLVARSIYKLHQRFAAEVFSVIENHVAANVTKLARGEVAANSLLALCGSGQFRRDLCEKVAFRIADVLDKDLRIRFQSTPPKAEQELQDAAEAALGSAQEHLEREGPLVPYSVVRTKPDFSTDRTTVPLYVETKYVKNKNSLRYATKSIGQSSSYYVDQGAFVLFFVFVDGPWIPNQEEFSSPFESKTGVIVRICRR